MQEIFWFFLGASVHLMLDKLIVAYKKVKFVHEIKILSFQLIGYAFEQWVITIAAKYLLLEGDPDFDKERIKILKNDDEAEFIQWKKETTKSLINSIPPFYQSALEVKEWSDIMNHLEIYHRRVVNKKYAEVLMNETEKQQ